MSLLSKLFDRRNAEPRPPLISAGTEPGPGTAGNETDSYNNAAWTKIRQKVIGKPRDLRESSLFHKLSLIPLLAWIGLGADGLSSSSYGPEEAFRTLGSHTYLAVFLALATALTVFIIAYAYSRIIEHFPYGGGGYIVATHTLGAGSGLISGSALLVDYMLTITVSLASCGDALFSFLPLSFQQYKLFFVSGLILILVIMNLRGVKESVALLTPIFVVFVLTHVLLLGYAFFSHASRVVPLARQIHGDFSRDLGVVGWVGLSFIFLRAFSMGGGTYTGLEAVSNGMQIMREPRVQTGKRTMLYMAVSLAVTAGGLLICYLLFEVKPTEGKTMNAILANAVFQGWPLAYGLALITILSEGALLMVGAQAGFIDGPRVMANMATDAWLPRRFASLSERLAMQNGVLLMGGASLLLLLYTHGSVAALVVMYSINVFLTFSLSQLGMIVFFLKNKKLDQGWRKHISVHIIGFLLCTTILTITVLVKFREGGWVTILITGGVIGLCCLIRYHYRKVLRSTQSLNVILETVPDEKKKKINPPAPDDMTAILLVGGFGGFGLHSVLAIYRLFPNVFKNFIFVSVGEIDSGTFKGAAAIAVLKVSVKDNLEKYVKIANQYGFPADYRLDIGTDVVETATQLCKSVFKEYPHSIVFAGKLIFQKENVFQKVLHNETAFAIQRRLQWDGIAMMVLPIRVWF